MPRDVQTCSTEVTRAMTAAEKSRMYLSIYPDKAAFVYQFSGAVASQMLQTLGKKEMVINEYFPSLTIASSTYGLDAVKSLVMSYITDHCTICSISAELPQIERIADDIIFEYGYLKISEVLLFFQMLRSGYFRNGDNDRAKMFGSLSGQVINDCLYQFKTGFRSDILDSYRQEQAKAKRENELSETMTYQEKYEMLTAECLKNPSFLDIIKTNQWLMNKEIEKIEKYIEEFKHLRLLRTRVAEYIEKINSGADPKTTLKILERANDFLNETYPINK